MVNVAMFPFSIIMYNGEQFHIISICHTRLKHSLRLKQEEQPHIKHSTLLNIFS